MGPTDANRALGLIIKEARLEREGVHVDPTSRPAESNTADFKELTYELYGHGGVGFVINALSDNSNRAYTDVGRSPRRPT